MTGNKRTAGRSLDLLRRNRKLRRLYSAHLVSASGDWVAVVALMGFILEETRSSVAAALVSVAFFVPTFVMSPLSGLAADRWNRCHIMISADLVRLGLMMILVIHGKDASVVGALLIVTTMGIAGAFYGPASTSVVPSLVLPDDLAQANMLMSSAWALPMFIGSATGGIVTGAVGRQGAFFIDAVTFAVSILCLRGISVGLPQGDPRRGLPLKASDVAAGIRFARADPRVLALVVTKGVFSLAAGVIVLLPVFASQVFRAGDLGIGLLFSARGLGALLGPFLTVPLVREAPRRLFATIAIGMTVFGAAYILFPWAPSLWSALPIIFVGHLGGGSLMALSTYGLQYITPAFLRGRVFALELLCGASMSALSMLIAGVLAAAVDARLVTLAFGSIGVVMAIIWAVWTRPLWDTSIVGMDARTAEG